MKRASSICGTKWRRYAAFAVALSAVLFCGSAKAAVHVTFGGALTGAPGTDVDVPIVLDDASGVLGYFFEMTCDPSILQVLDVSSGSLTSGWTAPTFNAAPGSVTVAGLSATALSGSGSVAVIHLRILPAALNGQTAALTMTQFELNDAGIPAITTNSQIVIATIVQVSVPAAVSARPGETIQIPISVSDANGVLGYYMVLSYDSAIVQYLGAGPGSLTGSWGAPVVGIVPGTVSLAAIGATPLTGAGSIATLTFKVNDATASGQTTPIHFDTAELNDAAIATSVQHGSVAVVSSLPVDSWLLVPFLVFCAIVRLHKRVRFLSSRPNTR